MQGTSAGRHSVGRADSKERLPSSGSPMFTAISSPVIMPYKEIWSGTTAGFAMPDFAITIVLSVYAQAIARKMTFRKLNTNVIVWL